MNNDNLDLPLFNTDMVISIKQGDSVEYAELSMKYPIIDFKSFMKHLIPVLESYSSIQDKEILNNFENEFEDFKQPKIDLESWEL